MIEIDIDKSVYLECYHDILDCDDDIMLLWGGRDAGKSKYIAQRLVEKCMAAQYFKCILVKQSYESIKESQYQELKAVIHEWGLEELFDFRVSPLEIICANGNRFIARGCDKPEKMKSIKDPTDAWYEEGNQLTEEDYITVSTTLRANGVKTQEWLSFNPEYGEGNLEDFWIYKMFFKDIGHNKKNFSHTKEISFKVDNEIRTVDITYTSKHTTYQDNPFVSDIRKAKLEALSIDNPYYYSVFTLGEWGEKEIINPFITRYNPKVHDSTSAVFNPHLPLIIVFDFNLDPFAVNFVHMWRDGQGEHIHFFKELSVKAGSIPSVCDQIRHMFLNQLPGCLVTGDGSSRKRDISQPDHASHYAQIQKLLGLRPKQFKLHTNPPHATSRNDVNYLFANFPDLAFHPTNCKDTIRDIKTVQCDASSTIIKRSRKDITQQADHLDNVRYLVNTFCRPWIAAHQKRP